MLSQEDAAVSAEELDRLEKLIARARKEGR
jgi:hypothetical protein